MIMTLNDTDSNENTHMSISDLTMMDEGSSFGEDLIPITTNCCPKNITAQSASVVERFQGDIRANLENKFSHLELLLLR